MSIKVKVFLILGLGLTVLFGMMVFLSYNYFIPSFDVIEKEKIEKNIERIREAVDREAEYLSVTLADWSRWDDTYNFMLEKQDEYEEVNLTASTIENLEVDYMIFTDSKLKIKYLLSEEGIIHDSEIDFLSILNTLTKKVSDLESINYGLVLIGENPAWYAMGPILKNDGSGPTAGYMLFFKHITEANVKKISDITKINIIHHSIDQISVDKDVIAYKQILSENKNEVMKEVDKDVISSFLLIRNISQEPIMLLHFDTDREILRQGRKIGGYFVFFLSFGTILTLILINSMIEIFLSKRLIKLNQVFGEISSSNDFSKRVVMRGSDEMADMAKNLNEMLDALQKAHEKRVMEEEKSSAYLKVAGVAVVALNNQAEIVSINKKGMEMLELAESDNFVGLNWMEKFIPGEEKEKVKNIFSKIISGESLENIEYTENWVITKNNNKRLVRWRNTTVKDSQGKNMGTVSAGEDITERKIVEDTEKKNIEEIKKLNELMVGRELRMIELKKEIENLKSKLKILK